MFNIIREQYQNELVIWLYLIKEVWQKNKRFILLVDFKVHASLPSYNPPQRCGGFFMFVRKFRITNDYIATQETLLLLFKEV